ncbi:MAG: phosphate propanoyltransferase [Nitrospirae bacterium YQR-1]
MNGNVNIGKLKRALKVCFENDRAFLLRDRLESILYIYNVIFLMKMGCVISEIEGVLNSDEKYVSENKTAQDIAYAIEVAEGKDEEAKVALSGYCDMARQYIQSYFSLFGNINIDETGLNGLNEIKADGVIKAIEDLLPGDGKPELWNKPFPINVSAHHVHLSKDDFHVLFGDKDELTPKAMLSQPGQFAAQECVNLIGPKGAVERVRILGPFRKESQVEISRTEEFKLGINAPVRDSGNIEGTPGIVLQGDNGELKLKKGVICARRHIHMSPYQAHTYNINDMDVVMVKVKTGRELIFGNVLVRVHNDFNLDMHIDTDEANAAEINNGAIGFLEDITERKSVRAVQNC